MDVTLLLKITGIGILVAFAYQILSKSGRDEQAMLISVTGIVLILLLLTDKIGELFASVRGVFGL